MCKPLQLLRKAALLCIVGGLSHANAQVSIQMLIVGGGGGGGRNAGTNSSGGGGGGGGQVVYATTSAAVGAAYTITVGAGGNGYQNSPLVTETNGGASSVTHASSSWSAVGGNAGTDATSATSEGIGGASVNPDGSGAGGRGGIYNNGNTPSGWPAAGGNGTSTYSTWGAATATGQLSGSTYYYGGGGAGGNWGGQLGSGVAVAGLGGGGVSNTSGTANTGGGGGGANSNGHSGFAINAGNGGSGLVIIMYPGTVAQATGGTITTSGGNTYHTFTSSGTFTVNSTILPSVWQFFNAVRKDGAVELNWLVTEDMNDLEYEIERSTDGTNFYTIASIAARGSLDSGQYSFTDSHPGAGEVYYRIEQVDAGDEVTYSNTAIVATDSTSSAASIAIFPNPIHDRLNITLSANASGTNLCTVCNVSGAVVLERALAAGQNSISLQELAAGIYFVAVWENGVCVRVEKVVK